jgi:hypothetical protein
MNAVPFDTLKMAQRLEAAGFSGSQAAGAAEALAEVLAGADPATKADLNLVRSDLNLVRGDMATKADLNLVRSDLDLVRSDMATKADLNLVRSDLDLVRSDMATKADLNLARSDLDLVRGNMATKSDVAALEAKLVAAIELARRDMTIKLGGMIVIGVGVLAALHYLPVHS